MTDVLFGQSYFPRFDPKLYAQHQPYPPLGTLYAASYLRSLGIDVGLFDAMLANSVDDWRGALDRASPRIAVIYEDNFNYLSKMCLLRMRQAAFEMIRLAAVRGIPVVVAGSDASDRSAAYLEHGATYVLIGEGELTLGELARYLLGKSDQPLELIQGVAYQGPEGIVRNASRPDLKDLDSLPFPAWDLVDVDCYRKIWVKHHGYYSVNLVSSRGCPYHCNWCAKPIWGQRYHARDPRTVADEVAWLRSTIAPDHLWFADDILGLKPGWIQEFAEEIDHRGIRTPFKSLNRADLVIKGNTAVALARAGAQTVWLGAESGSQAVLDAMEKGTRVEQIADATRRLHAAGIKVGFFLQFGYPGETLADIEQTLHLVRWCKPDDIGVSVSYPLPGTKFHAAVREQLGQQQNWIDSDDLAMLYHGPFGTAFYRKLHQVVHHDFRWRREWRELRRGQSGGNAFARKLIRGSLSLAYHRLALPFSRWQLMRLAAGAKVAIKPITPELSPDAAARPSVGAR
ncbi:MAG TPA: radical SAM protein [Chloroflexota bacterium]|nr:radical SAM protein [Chloroflexota bacterium]